MFKGKTAIVTGSTSGIGWGVAYALAKEGAHIMLNGIADEASLAKLRADISSCGVRVEYSPADVAKIDQTEEMIDETVRTFGSCDIVVNNAGLQFVSPIEDFPLDQWDSVMATNLFSAFYATRKVLPIMRQKGWGRIINIAAFDDDTASVNKIAYVAAKHGVVGITKVTALETAGSGITCNAICPSWATTDDTNAPAKKFAKPEDVGTLAAYLCSDAAAQITGASYAIDGTWPGA